MTDHDPADPLDLSFSDPELDRVHDHITGFIHDQYTDANADRVVIGLSGGIDSSLTAYLSVDALEADTVHGLILPSNVNPTESAEHAYRVADDLGIHVDEITISPIVDAITTAYPDDPGTHAIGNVRVRTRAVLTYLFANTTNALVIGTGNRTEALVGYFTKHGDGAVDCHPIGSLYKQQVRQLARHVGVPDAVITKPPSAEMWTGQTDEDELGLDYDTLDAILALTIDGSVPPSAVPRILDTVTPADVERVRDLHERSHHKRRTPPSPRPLF